LSRAGSSTNVGPERSAIRSISAAGAGSEGTETDALDTAELSGGWAGWIGESTGADAGRGFSSSSTINLNC